MRNILIISQYATNKGDRAVAEFIISQLLMEEDVKVILSTTNPALWKNLDGEERVQVIETGLSSTKKKNSFFGKIKNKVRSWYYTHFLYKDLISKQSKRKLCKKYSYKFIHQIINADLVIVTGGHHITSIRNKNALYNVTYDIGLASLFAKKYILWAQTIGPLKFTDDKAKSFFQNVIVGAERVYIRDNNSEICLNELLDNPPKNMFKSYDSVFGFGDLEVIPFSQREKKVGISIFNGLKKAFSTFPQIAELLDFYAEQGFEIEFFKMEHTQKETDDIMKIVSLMKEKANIKIFPFETSTKEHLKELSSCKFFIGYKTHSVIMALATSTPVLAISYHKKTRDFMSEYGLEKFAIDDEKFTAEQGVEIAKQLMVKGEDVHIRMKEHSLFMANKVKKDFRDIFNDNGTQSTKE